MNKNINNKTSNKIKKYLIEIPNTLEIAGYTYNVLYNKDITIKLLEDCKKAGILYGSREIHFDYRSDNQEISNGFIHEILHGVDQYYNNHELNEDTIERMANGLHQIFNQLGIEFILKKENNK